MDRGDHRQKFYWGHKEILIPVFKNMADAMKKHPEVDVLINFASLRSAYDSTVETMNYPQVCEWARISMKVILMSYLVILEMIFAKMIRQVRCATHP